MQTLIIFNQQHDIARLCLVTKWCLCVMCLLLGPSTGTRVNVAVGYYYPGRKIGNVETRSWRLCTSWGTAQLSLQRNNAEEIHRRRAGKPCERWETTQTRERNTSTAPRSTTDVTHLIDGDLAPSLGGPKKIRGPNFRLTIF